MCNVGVTICGCCISAPCWVTSAALHELNVRLPLKYGKLLYDVYGVQTQRSSAPKRRLRNYRAFKRRLLLHVSFPHGQPPAGVDAWSTFSPQYWYELGKGTANCDYLTRHWPIALRYYQNLRNSLSVCRCSSVAFSAQNPPFTPVDLLAN